MKILFFIGSLRNGGKERRMIELMSHLKTQGDKYGKQRGHGKQRGQVFILDKQHGKGL